MNRLSPHSGSKPGFGRGWADNEVDFSIATTAYAGGLKHRIFAPLHYEPNYAYPLLVWLHGGGSDERQLIRIMPFVSMRNYVAVAPRCPWESLDDSGSYWRSTPQPAAEVASGILDCIAGVQKRYHIAADRIFIAGYQDGGEMALRIALDHPHQFAGAASINGAFPRMGTPLAGLAQSRSIPLLICHGEASSEYSQDQLCDDIRLFHAAGMNVTVRQYEKCGDELHSMMLRDLNVWIMELVTGQEHSNIRYIDLGDTADSGQSH